MIRSENDILIILHILHQAMDKLYFSETEQQKVFVSVSELARNVLYYAGGSGSFQCEIIDNNGIVINVIDEGPGIPDLQNILNGNKSNTSKGLGLGLSSVHRLMDDVKINTTKKGTRISAIKWKEK